MNRRLDPETRRDQLLEAAGELFLKNGYKDTSVNSIVESIGVSKGTFYYYFDSKEGVLDGLVEKLGEPIYEEIDEIVSRDSSTAIEKLNDIFAASRRIKLDKIDEVLRITRLMYRPENLRLLDRIESATIDVAAPKIARVVKQGVEEGVLDTRFPEEASRLIFSMGADLNEETGKMLLGVEAEVDGDELARKYNAYENAIERILGAPDGSIVVLEEEDLNKFVSHLNRMKVEENQ